MGQNVGPPAAGVVGQNAGPPTGYLLICLTIDKNMAGNEYDTDMAEAQDASEMLGSTQKKGEGTKNTALIPLGGGPCPEMKKKDV